MRAYSFYLLIFLILASLTALLIGCEYDVAEPLWNKPPLTAVAAVIDSVVPARAVAGVNIITIYGKNLTGAIDTTSIHTFQGRDTIIIYNGVYFDKLPAVVTENSSTAIKVRRPNMVADSSTIQVTPDAALSGAKISPYKIDPVLEKTDNFAINVELNVIAVDNLGNYYVLERNSKVLSKFSSLGVRTRTDTLTTAPKTLSTVPVEARISPVDGMLYMTGNVPLRPSTSIRRVDLVNMTVNNSWVTLASGRGVTYFDFDASGNIYAGGYNSTGSQYSGLVVVTPAGVVTYYTSDVIQAITVYQGYVYVAYKSGTSALPAKIARHTIDAGGNVGSQEIILDMTTSSIYPIRVIRSISFASDGTMYLGSSTTLDPNPMLVVTPIGVTPQVVDYFYKSILPECSKFCSCWGNGTILYMIGGTGTTTNGYDIYKIDMGATVGAR
jgi:hypothetical protein